MSEKEYVILVDEQNNDIGAGEKLQVHRDGLLHRAFSIFVFNNNNELLIQRRAKVKYHSGGLWANTCCGHPRSEEKLHDAVGRRLMEEMGFCCDLKELFSFMYKTTLDNGLIEHEYDFVFVGKYNGKIDINLNEVEEYRWISMGVLKDEIKRFPNRYAYWLQLILKSSNHLLDKIY